MRAILIALILASCTATEVGNTLLPDELTLGRGSSTSSMSGGLNTWYNQQGDDWPIDMAGESEASYAALTWHLPALKEEPTRAERAEIRKEALLIDEIVYADEDTSLTMASGGAYTADWRHAATFGGILGLLLIVLLIKLQRNNGWH